MSAMVLSRLWRGSIRKGLVLVPILRYGSLRLSFRVILRIKNVVGRVVRSWCSSEVGCVELLVFGRQGNQLRALTRCIGYMVQPSMPFSRDLRSIHILWICIINPPISHNGFLPILIILVAQLVLTHKGTPLDLACVVILLHGGPYTILPASPDCFRYIRPSP